MSGIPIPVRWELDEEQLAAAKAEADKRDAALKAAMPRERHRFSAFYDAVDFLRAWVTPKPTVAEVEDRWWRSEHHMKRAREADAEAAAEAEADNAFHKLGAQLAASRAKFLRVDIDTLLELEGDPHEDDAVWLPPLTPEEQQLIIAAPNMRLACREVEQERRRAYRRYMRVRARMRDPDHR